MNREIKFRAWSKATEKMMDWDFIKSHGNLNKLLYLDHVEVMQFTGLTDKNGKEIYEGDQLFYAASNHSSMIVKFENGSFVGEGPFNTLPLSQYISATDFEFIEVIGNILETLNYYGNN